ncbi:MAG: PAS domain S-box protein [Rhodobiaceae bacterium]|nr:PAS domain S-box protein [Rhodobiaceae bacterium]MCC0056043.1 PAS domain S-box protein [Rhodobiaceae bacterium]
MKGAIILANHEQILNAILCTSADGIINADASGHITGWNAAAAHILGYSADDAIGQPLTLIVPPRFHDQHLAGFARVLSGGERHIIGKTVEVAAVAKDGMEVPVELSLATGEAAGERFFTAIMRDVSARHKLIDEIKGSEARLNAVLESANDGIITIDSSGLVRQWNGGAEHMFSRSRDEMIGKPLLEVIPERYRKLHEAGIERVTGGGERHAVGHTVELSALRRDGTEFPVELSLSTWQSGEGMFFSGIIRDITERKTAEEKLHHANTELAEKNEMLEGLSAKLAKYLSRQVYDSIFEGKTDVKVASYRKLLTVFFSDIQGFTELSDRLEPEPVSRLLNSYLSEMSDIALEHGGTVDKFIGDGIMIFFGDPETKGQKEDAVACARMALAMRERVRGLKEEWRAQLGQIDLHIRIGINTGYCTVGNFGSDNRMDYTIVGREVNTASRLESTASSDQIQISDDTYELVRDMFECRPVGELKVKGLAYPVRTYELAGPLVSAGHADPADVLELGDKLAHLSPEQVAEARAELTKALDALGKTPEKGES